MQEPTTRRIRRGLRRRAGVAARAVGLRPAAPAPPPARKPRRPRPAGIVEQFTRSKVVGWVSVPAGAPPTKVTLRIGRVAAVSTIAKPGAAISSSWEGEPRPEQQPARVPPIIPSPQGDRRNSRVEIRSFYLRVHGIWPYVRKNTEVSVRVNGYPLPIYGHGMFLQPRRSGKLGPGRLREKLASGHVFAQDGSLQLSKKLDTEWQARVMGLHDRVRAVVKDRFDHDVWFVYGTLLGAVRERYDLVGGQLARQDHAERGGRRGRHAATVL